jgi:hypothetical protein
MKKFPLLFKKIWEIGLGSRLQKIPNAYLSCVKAFIFHQTMCPYVTEVIDEK